MASARSLGTLTLNLIAQIGGFTGPLSKAEREAQRRLSSIEKRAQAFGKAMGTALKVGAVAAVAGITLITKQAIDAADEMRDLSIRLGTSTETLSAFGYAASQTGTDIETLGRGMKLLAKNAADALNPTSEQAKVFAALGVTVTDAEGKLKDLGALIPEIADKFKGLQDGTTKAALAQSLFGKSGLELTEFLNQGSEGLDQFARRAEELGIIIDTKTAAAADEFKDGLGDLKAAVGGLGLDIAKELLPALNETVKSFVNFAKEGDLASNVAALLSGTLRAGVAVLEGYGNAVDRVSIAFGFAANAAKGFAEIQRNLGPGGLFAEGSVAGGMQQVKNALSSSQKELDDLIKRQNNPFKGVSSRVLASGASAGGGANVNALQQALAGGGAGGSKKSKGGKSDAEKEAESLQRAYESMNERLKEQVALFGETSESAQLRYELENGELAKLTQVQKDGLLVQAERLDQMRLEKDLTEAAAKEVQKQSEAYQQSQEQIKDLIGDMEFELSLLGLTNKEREWAIALQYAGADATDEQRRAIIDLSDSLVDAREKFEFFDDVKSSLADAFVDFATGAKSAKEAFGDFADTIFKRSVQLLADKAVEALFNAFSGGASGASGSAGGGGWGEFFGSLFGGAKAGGGVVNSGMFYQVNEHGPEMLSVGGRDFLMMGNQSGKVTPNNQLRSGGGNTTIINVQPTTTRRTAQQIAQANDRAQRQASLRNG